MSERLLNPLAARLCCDDERRLGFEQLFFGGNDGTTTCIIPDVHMNRQQLIDRSSESKRPNGLSRSKHQ